MELFHGSNKTIEKPDICHTRKNGGKDFGEGFYLTGELKMAKNFAAKVVKRSNSGEASVSAYEVRLDNLHTCQLKIKKFSEPSPEWFVFVYENRTKTKGTHEYDIVIGPVADNGLPEKIAEYERAVREEREIDLRHFANAINYHHYPNTYQYCFRSEEALTLLRYIPRL